MLFRRNIIEKLDLVIKAKITADELAKHFQVSRSWIFELLRRKKKGESLERARGHRNSLFSEGRKNQIKQLYKELILEDGKAPSMTVLRECMKMTDGSIPEASTETYRSIVKTMAEYPEKRNRKIYRKRFEAPSVGFLVQGDVTTHAWIDGAYPFSLLMFIDDKSRYVLFARFIDSDNIENHKIAVKEWLGTFGKPSIVYYDNDPKYARKGQIRGILEKMGIKVINTRPYQPQGKGKLERKNGVFQDQLVHYLKFKKADTFDKANEVLNWYVVKHNQTYNREIGATPEEVFKNSEDVFIDITDKEWQDIELTFAAMEKRKVSKVNEISINGKKRTVPRLGNIPLSGCWVDIFMKTHYWIRVYYKNQLVTEFNWGDIYDEGH